MRIELDQNLGHSVFCRKIITFASNRFLQIRILHQRHRNRILRVEYKLNIKNIKIFFIVIIESISIIIRPITLSVRLSANIMAGHVILALISSFSFMEPSLFMVRLFVQLILFTLETSVALVQPYVFFTLLSLYKGELDQYSLNKLLFF